MKKHPRYQEWLLLAAIFFFWFSCYTYPSFFSAYVVNVLQAPEVTAGLILGSYGFMQMLLRIPLGVVSDVLQKRKAFVLIGFAASLASSAGLTILDLSLGEGAIPTWIHIAAMLFRGLSGVAASTWVTLSVMYSSNFQKEEMPSAMSRLMVPQYGSQIFAMLLGSHVAGRFGEWTAFALASGAGLLGLILAAMVKENCPQKERMSLKSFFTVAKDRDLFIGTVLATLLRVICWGTVLGFLSTWAQNAAGFTTEQLGYLSVMYLLPNTIMARFSGPVFSKRFGRRNALAAGFLILAIACSLYPFSRSLWPLMATQTVFGMGMGLILPLTLSASVENIPPERRGVSMGIYQAVYGAGMSLGPVLAGWIISLATTQLGGYVINFYFNAVLSAFGAALSLLLLRSEKNDNPRA